MKIFALTAAAIAALSAVEATEQSSIHLRIHEKGGSCTITNESQCNGQNWSGSTCCADSNYECRWSDDGQNVQRCQKKKATGNTGGGGGGSVADWGTCTGNLNCKNAGSTCVKHSNYYSQCKPKTLPAGELCGQNDGTNVWKYDKCPSNQKCAALGSDFRCTNKKHQKKDAKKPAEKYEQYKRHQKKSVEKDTAESENTGYSDVDDYSSVDDYSYGGGIEYASYADDYGDCTSFDVGCSNPTSWCISHSEFYAQCKPDTLPPGELCGQDDGTNVWYYPYCTSGETCESLGTDYRCTKAKKRHHHHRRT